MLPKALKSYPKSNKSPSLVTLATTKLRTPFVFGDVDVMFNLNVSDVKIAFNAFSTEKLFKCASSTHSMLFNQLRLLGVLRYEEKDF